MKLIALTVALLALFGPACQVAPSGTSNAPSTPLAKADAKLFGGDYDGAEADYQKLSQGGDMAAKAHYALLLDYENRFSEAITQASAAAGDGGTWRGYAALTRALDWAENVNGALEAGGKAVAAAPGDPLANAFYGEVLADAAHFDAARAALRKAERSANDAFTRAEVEREWANFYRGRGDLLEELNHLQLSLRHQPDFPERTLELARYDYDAQQADAARKLLNALGAKHPNDYGLSVAIADTAFLHADSATAEKYYQRALKVHPTGASASLGEAELLVSARRDFNGAHDLVLPALKAAPDNVDLSQFLRYLDLLVLKTDPDSEIPAPTSADRITLVQQALAQVDSFRAKLSLPALAESPELDRSAVAHAYFWLFNFGQPAVAGLKIHQEDASLPGAFGADVLARGRHFGYNGPRASEVISHVYQPLASVDHWVDAVYHRYPLSDPDTVSAGFGQAVVGALSIQVLDLGLQAATHHDVLVYPHAGQTTVPTAFLGDEVPDPAPTARYPTGYPITLQVGAASTLAVTAAELDGPSGAPVKGYVVDSTNNGLPAYEWGVLPRDPLLPGGQYTMKVSGTVDGADFTKVWSFTVAPAP